MQKAITAVRVALFVFMLSFCSPWSQTAMSADCVFFKSKIKKERSLIKLRPLYLQAVEHCPNDAGLRYSYGLTLERLRKYGEALQQYSRAVELEPNMSKAFFNMADIYTSQDKLNEAIAAYQSGLQIDPGNTRARKNLRKLQKVVTNG